MVDYYSFLNYIAFSILYIICLYFVSQEFTEIIGFYILFIIHAASSIFIGKDILNIFTNEGLGNTSFLIKITLLVVLSGLCCNFVSLILVILTLANAQTKYDSSRGTPLRLPDRYRGDINEFKINLIIMFVITFVILISCYFDYLTGPSIQPKIKTLLRISLLGISYLIIHYSIKQVNLATNLSKLKNKKLLGKK